MIKKKLDEHLFTEEGLTKIKSELDELTNQKRPLIVKRVAVAREQGDLKENSEYAAAREELNLLDKRISELEEAIKNAKVVKHRQGSKVEVGNNVTVELKGKQITYAIVGEQESDPSKKKISYTSPLGTALMGQVVGDQVEVDAPAGKIVYKIVKIE